MINNETIAAIATSSSESSISIIRVSGPDALLVGDRIFKGKNSKKVSDYKSHTIHYGFIYENDVVIDEVILSIMKAPKSYTTEDTIEINCHGGMLITQKILKIVLNNGARLAEPGEFTKRAFLNGRIDLSSAEAVMDVIASESDLSLKSSLNQLCGSVFEEIKDIRAKVIFEIAYIESALDDPEHISLDGYPEELKERVSFIIKRIKKMIDSFNNGRIIRDGVNTVILGKPNAGKSSLLNMLSGFERAIVTDIAGTTRDIIEERIRLGNIVLNLSDTAGIRESLDKVEQIGVDKALKSCEDADLILYVVDSSTKLDDNDFRIIEYIKNRKCIVVFNKSDLSPLISFEELRNLLPDKDLVRTSTLEESGIEELGLKIQDMFINKSINPSNEVVITNIRQRDLLNSTLNSLIEVIKSIDNGMSEDFFSIDLMNAYQNLGFIIGEEISDDLVNEIFSKFCMGK